MFWAVAVAVAVVLAFLPSAGRATASDTTGTTLSPRRYRDQPPVAYLSRGQAYILDGRGQAARPVREGSGACCLRWAPDGAHLGFQRGGDLWIASSDGTGTRRVAPSVRQWAWAPDGEAIAATPRASSMRDGTGVDFYAIDEPRVRRTLLRHYDVLDFAWPGIGRQLAVSARPHRRDQLSPAAPADLFMLEVPGPYGGDCATLCPEPPQRVVIDARSGANADVFVGSWSPDFGRLAVWTGGAGPDPPVGALDLSVLSTGGGPLAYLTRTVVQRSWVQWSYASDRLLVVEADGLGSGSALALCSTATGCRVVAGSAGSVLDPVWSDDGRMAYVTSATASPPGTSGTPPGPDQSRLWVADGDGNAATVVATGGATSPQWLPDGRHLLFLRSNTLWLLDSDHGSSIPLAGPLGASPSRVNADAPPPGVHRDEPPFAVAP